MKPNRSRAWTQLAICRSIGLAFLLAGCSDFSEYRVGGIRNRVEEATVAPVPAPALAISNAPVVAPGNTDPNVKPATFVPQRDQPMLEFQPNDPNGQLMQHPLRILHQRAAQRYATMDSYLFRLKRRESVNGTKLPEEMILVKVRRDPFSVYLKWLGTVGKGRETIFVRGKYNNEMQVLLAANDAFPFSPAGMRWALSPNDKQVKAKSRHPITATGFGSLIEQYGKVVAGVERGDPQFGTAKYLGRVKRPEFPQEVEAVHQVLPAGADPGLPKGGQRWWYFDASNGLPVLVIAHDLEGEVEYYCHDYIQAPVRLDDDDFDPDRVWRK